MRAPRLLVAITLAALLAAGSAPAWSLDLMQAYQAALAQDARIRAARAARDSAIERLPQARAQLLPNIAITLVVFAVAYKPLKKYLTGEDLPRASAAAQKAQADKEDKNSNWDPER